MSERLNLIVDDGIGSMMAKLADGERKRGQWLTNLVRAMYEQRQSIPISDLEELRMGFTGMVGALKILESRVVRLEQQVDTIENSN